MNRVEQMRQKQTANGNASKPPEAKAPKPAPAAAPKPAQPVVRYSCGHDRPLADVASKQCPACRQEAAARRAARNAAKPARLDATHGRLPDGAAYHKQYDAATQTWTATLTIPGLPVMTAMASGSYTVERLLDGIYRQQVRDGRTPSDEAASTDPSSMSPSS
jgi:hypothetical protein